MRVAVIGLRSLTASGGIETMVRETSVRLVGLGADVTVFCRARYNPERLSDFHGVRVVDVPTNKCGGDGGGRQGLAEDKIGHIPGPGADTGEI